MNFQFEEQPAFVRSSKRRRGFPSETNVKRGFQSDQGRNQRPARKAGQK